MCVCAESTAPRAIYRYRTTYVIYRKVKFKESKLKTFRRLSTNTGIKGQNIKNEILIARRKWRYNKKAGKLAILTIS